MKTNKEHKIYCPTCGQSEITANKKGFSGGQAVAGAVLLGPLGLVAGAIGSSKVKITCLSCGFEFKAGNGANEYQAEALRRQAKEKAESHARKEDDGGTNMIVGGIIGLIAFIGIMAYVGSVLI